MCYCEHCRQAFVAWLKNKYQTLDNLNQAWNAKFWAHTIHDWDEIVVPNKLSEKAGAKRLLKRFHWIIGVSNRQVC